MEGELSIDVIPLDDYDLIMGMEFLDSVRAMIDMRTKYLIITVPQYPLVVPMIMGWWKARASPQFDLWTMGRELGSLQSSPARNKSRRLRWSIPSTRDVNPCTLPSDWTYRPTWRWPNQRSQASKESAILQEGNNSLRVKSAEDVAQMGERECHGIEVFMCQGPCNINEDSSKSSRVSGMFPGTSDTIITPCSRIFIVEY